ncbi:nitrilase-related carbon-nitrogen hydrolase [Halobellus sp. GM3]|uniref:nitrilase-related carbon-nitrogen hydrolase n=1 Tax=Halobellus sp. GM3 TaxID=3458410 RepID=UPI00403E1965
MSTTVAACQLDVEDLAVEANLTTVERRVVGLPDDVEVAVFPECALTGFVADRRVTDVALRREDDQLDRLVDVAACEETALVVGFVERSGDSLYNATAYVAPDGVRAVYRKRHLRGGEADVLDAGEDIAIVETPVGRAGILTCYDLNFVADSAELTRERVDALFVGGAWPAAYSENWTLLVRARALDGVRWAVGAGRTGRRTVADAPVVEYAGRSIVARPDGGVHAALDRRADDIVVDLDPAALEAQRELIGIYDDSRKER